MKHEAEKLVVTAKGPRNVNAVIRYFDLICSFSGDVEGPKWTGYKTWNRRDEMEFHLFPKAA